MRTTRLAPLLLLALSAGCDDGTAPRLTTPAAAEAASGDGQSGTVGRELAAPLVVRALDEAGRPVAGRPVVWTARGGGSLAGADLATDARGLARVRWTLGPSVADSQRVEVRVLAGRAAVQATFRASSQADSPAEVRAVAGAAQSGVVGAPLPEPLAVRVVDRFGNPLAGVALAFRVAAGGGAVDAAAATTDAAGMARTRWTLGTSAADSQRVEVRVATGGEAAPSLRVAATAVADAPAAMEPVGATSRQGIVGAPLADSVAVRLVDRFGNPVAGVAVAWSVPAGAGSATPASSITDAAGIARTRWTLGLRVDSAEALVASAGPAMNVRFTGTAALGTDFRLEEVLPQNTNVQLERWLLLTAKLTLLDGRPIQGAPAAWFVTGVGNIYRVGRFTQPDGRVTAEFFSSEYGSSPVYVKIGDRRTFFHVRVVPTTTERLRLVKRGGDAQVLTLRGEFVYSNLMSACVEDSGGYVLSAPVSWHSAAHLEDTTPPIIGGSPPHCSEAYLILSAPGVYTATATFQDQSVTFTVTVIPDPDP